MWPCSLLTMFIDRFVLQRGVIIGTELYHQLLLSKGRGRVP